MDNRKHPPAGVAGSGDSRRPRVVRLCGDLHEHSRHYSPTAMRPIYVFDRAQPPARRWNPLQITRY